MRHYMKLHAEPFGKIARGEKTVEMRLYDEKRRAVNVGDTIVFTLADDDGRSIEVTVTAVHVFSGFDELYASLPLDKCGYRPGEQASPVDMNRYYTKKQQAEYGACGIEFVKNN